MLISLDIVFIPFIQGDDVGDREYSLYDDNMSGSDTDESGGEDDTADPVSQSSPFSHYQLPPAGMGMFVHKTIFKLAFCE